jgi:hypothetical protein
MTQITYISRSYTDMSVTIAISGIRYEYFFPTWQICDRAQYITLRWPGRGLNYAKRKALRTERMDKVASAK